MTDANNGPRDRRSKDGHVGALSQNQMQNPKIPPPGDDFYSNLANLLLGKPTAKAPNPSESRAKMEQANAIVIALLRAASITDKIARGTAALRINAAGIPPALIANAFNKAEQRIKANKIGLSDPAKSKALKTLAAAREIRIPGLGTVAPKLPLLKGAKNAL